MELAKIRVKTIYRIRVQTLYVNGERIHKGYRKVNYNLMTDPIFVKAFEDPHERKAHADYFEKWIPRLLDEVRMSSATPHTTLTKPMNFRSWCYRTKELKLLFVRAVKLSPQDPNHYNHFYTRNIILVRERERRLINIRNLKAVWRNRPVRSAKDDLNYLTDSKLFNVKM